MQVGRRKVMRVAMRVRWFGVVRGVGRYGGGYGGEYGREVATMHVGMFWVWFAVCKLV